MSNGTTMKLVSETKSTKAENTENMEWAAKHPPTKLSFLGTSFEQTGKALKLTFGDFPIQLDKFTHEHILVGMVNAAGEGKAPYEALLDAVRKYGEIEVRLA